MFLDGQLNEMCKEANKRIKLCVILSYPKWLSLLERVSCTFFFRKCFLSPLSLFSLYSGYDFAYLLKVLTAQNLPSEESDFFDLLKLYFPNIYDVKYLMKSCKSLKGGLQEVAELLEVKYGNDN